jgi:hypothetical protein
MEACTNSLWRTIRGISIAAIVAFAIVSAIASCNDIEGDDKTGGAKTEQKKPPVKLDPRREPEKGVMDHPDDTELIRDMIRMKDSVTPIYKWKNTDDAVIHKAATTVSGSTVFFADASANESGYAVYSKTMPDGEVVEVFGIPSMPENFIASANGETVFALCGSGGYLYSIKKNQLLARVDYDLAKVTSSISPDGQVFVSWGGGNHAPYHYTAYFEDLRASQFWDNPVPSDVSQTYGIRPVEIFPSYAIAQMIIQVGTLENPVFTFLSLNMHQHSYTNYTVIGGYITRGSLSKDGLIYRTLFAPAENLRARNDKGEIPFTHRAIIDMKTFDFSAEALKTIFTGVPIAISRLADNVLVRSADGGLEIRNLDSGKPVYLVSKARIGDVEILAWSADVTDVLVSAGGELRFIDMTHFPAKDEPGKNAGK